MFDLEAVDIEANVLLLNRSTFVVPLDDVESVWREGDKWCVRVRGYFEMNAPQGYRTRVGQY
jgi:hypothetical protein